MPSAYASGRTQSSVHAPPRLCSARVQVGCRSCRVPLFSSYSSKENAPPGARHQRRTLLAVMLQIRFTTLKQAIHLLCLPGSTDVAVIADAAGAVFVFTVVRDIPRPQLLNATRLLRRARSWAFAKSFPAGGAFRQTLRNRAPAADFPPFCGQRFMGIIFEAQQCCASSWRSARISSITGLCCPTLPAFRPSSGGARGQARYISSRNARCRSRS